MGDMVRYYLLEEDKNEDFNPWDKFDGLSDPAVSVHFGHGNDGPFIQVYVQKANGGQRLVHVPVANEIIEDVLDPFKKLM